jgi:5-methylcytosine-specific restriction endonuclease McrA
MPKPHKLRPSPSSLNRPSSALRKKIKERDGNRCQRCGTAGSAENRLEVHHRRRVADGGGHDERNLVTLCQRCHRMQ